MKRYKLFYLLIVTNIFNTIFCLPLDKQILNKQKLDNPKQYVVFDIGKTFWDKSLYDLLYSYQKQKGVPLSYYFKMVKFGASYLMGSLDTKKAFESFLSYSKGISEKELKDGCSKLWEKECKNNIYKEAIKLFESYKKNSAVLIISEPGMKQLYDNLIKSYKFDHVCSSELEIKNGLITGKLIGEPCSGQEKCNKVKNLIEKNLNGSLKDTVFYANSHNDIPLIDSILNSGGKVFTVNPDNKLKKYAKTKKLQILVFKEVNG